MNRLLRAVAILSVTALAGLGVIAPAAAQPPLTIYVVNSNGDDPDVAIDGVCATSLGVCTLRAAITEAVKTKTAVLIDFAIPGDGVHTIAIGSRLPAIKNPNGITIDGYSQPGSVVNTAETGSNAQLMIQIRGGGTDGFNAFLVSGPDNVFRGLSVFDVKVAFYVSGTSADSNAWLGNFVCTDATGTFRADHLNAGGGGILFNKGPSFNTIGVPADYDPGTVPNVADRNVISGCPHRGIIISFGGTKSNAIYDNLIGLRPDNSGPNGNFSHGVDVNYNAQDNVIGGPLLHQGNVVSGNLQEGIEVSHGPFNRRNDVVGNFVGTDATGAAAPTWAGNAMMGIRMEGDEPCDPCDLNSGFHEVADNVVVGNGGGIQIDKGAQHDDVHDNLIGMLPDGTPASNSSYGIRIEQGASFHLITHNTIAYNSNGIQVQPTATFPTNSFVLAPLSNTFTQNSIFANGGLGIDLSPYGKPNVNGVSDDVAGGIQAPVIGSATKSAVTVSTCAGCTVELYDTGRTGGIGTGLKAYGQGKTYLLTGTADSSGSVVLSVTGIPLKTGKVLAALATDTSGNTSEFSRDVSVTP